MRIPCATMLALLVLVVSACGGSMIERLPTGDSWYRMEDPDGGPLGYAHLIVGVAAEGGRRVDWELRLAFPGGTYEEWRSMTVDGEGALVAASYRNGEGFSTDLRRRGNEWSVSTSRGEESSAAIVEIPADALTGMLFVLAGALPLSEGATWERIELNEAEDFVSLGTTVFACCGPEAVEIEGGEVPAHLVELRRADGTVLPVWVGEDRSILRVDWGGGNLMTLASGSTEHLFDPKPPAVTEVESGPGKLVVAGRFPALTPERAYDHFTKPELLTLWWPPQAEVDPEPGGRYHLRWPDQEWFMRGEVRAAEPGSRLVFTWTWDHQEGEATVREVEVAFAPHPDGGTLLTLTQGPYGDSAEEREARASHLKGWEHFLTRLHALE